MSRNKGADGNYYSLIRYDIVALVPKNARRILECGCGRGLTGKELKKLLNCEITGIEIFEEAAKEAEKHLDKVLLGNIEEMNFNFKEKYFDSILFPDVLEHTKDPWAVLNHLKKYLSDDGIIIASIPNIQYLPALLKIINGKFEYEESGVLDKTHLRFFTLHTIKKMFDDCGFSIKKIISKKGNNWKFQVLNTISFGLLSPYSIYQYLLVVTKRSD